MSQRPSCPDATWWEELLEGQLSLGEQAALGRHLEACAACQQTLERLTAGDASWPETARSLGQPRPVDPALCRIMEDLKTGPDATEAHRPAGPVDLPFLQPPARPEHLGRLAGYEVLEVIGRGGMGVVLKALDPSLQRLVAIKVLAPQLATSTVARQRFEREARATAAVSHDHVVTIHAVEEADGLPYLVMEYVHGMSLQQHLDREGTLAVEEVLRIGMQTAAGLAAAHAQGLIHRDVKPANILLQDGVGRVKLSDFGLARAVDDASLTQSGVIAGTPDFMAPEQARGATLDHRADLFSLGSVLYALCTGRPPFRAATVLAVLKLVSEATPHPIRAVNPTVPDWLEEIVAALMVKEPADRFPSAAELAQLLRQHLRHLRHPTQVPRPPRLGRRSRPWFRLPGRWALLLAAFVAVALLSALAGRFVFGPKAGPHNPGAAQEVGPPILLVNGRLLRKGIPCTLQVDYIVRGELSVSPRCVWIVRSAGGLIHEEEFVPAQRGTLAATLFIPAPMLFAEPLETFLVVDAPGQCRQISNTTTLAR